MVRVIKIGALKKFNLLLKPVLFLNYWLIKKYLNKNFLNSFRTNKKHKI